MKKLYCSVFLLFITLCVVAQTKDSLSCAPPTHFVIVDPKPVDKHDKPLIVVDGFIFNGNIKQIDPNDILSVDVLNQPGATNIYGKQGVNGVILVMTKKIGIELYKKKFSSFSIIYNKYLQSHNDDDSEILYVIDEVVADKKDFKGMIARLYSIEIQDIKYFGMMDNSFRNGNKEKEMVVITTKKK